VELVSIPDWITAVASAVTASGVLLAWWQLRLTKRQALVAFEDGLNFQYRQIASDLPVEALLGEPLPEGTQRECLGAFYHYIDLTNEQVTLRRHSRISASTWDNWRQGISWNLSQPAFASAWQEIKTRSPESFDDLRRLESEAFVSDPASWVRRGVRVPNRVATMAPPRPNCPASDRTRGS
jgi:hypothetical protein